MNLERLKKRKTLFILTIITIISLILGMLFLSILSTDNKELIKDSINNYFKCLNTENINYLKGFTSNISTNLVINIFIWIVGISIVGILLVSLVLIFKSFLLGFSFISIIYTYGFKGAVVSTIYIIPEIINLFIIFLLVYYSISFSIILFNYLFRKKEFTRSIVVKRYIKLLLFTVIVTIINSLISVFIVPGILKWF